MFHSFLVLCFLLILFGYSKAENYAYVCTSVNDGVQEVELTHSIQPAPGKKIQIRLLSNVPTFAVCAAFQKDGQLVNNWRPQFLVVEPWEETKLPPLAFSWEWSRSEGPFQLHMLLLDPHSKEIDRLKKLISTIQNGSEDKQVQLLQARKLAQHFEQLSGGNSRLASDLKTEYARLGGVERGEESRGFAWRKFSKKIAFSSQQPGMLIYSWNPQ